jgi:hypothetical protein
MLEELKRPLPTGTHLAKLVAVEENNVLLFEATEGDERGKRAGYDARQQGGLSAKSYVGLLGRALTAGEVPDWESLAKLETLASIRVAPAGIVKDFGRPRYPDTNKRSAARSVVY